MLISEKDENSISSKELNKYNLSKKKVNVKYSKTKLHRKTPSPNDNKLAIIRKFHKMYSQITGKYHQIEKNVDLFIDDRYYEKFLIFEGLSAYYSIFSLVCGVSNYQFNYGLSQDKYLSYLYFCTFFSILLWLNLIFYELTYLEYLIEKKLLSIGENLYTSGKYKDLILTILCVFLHPNPLTDNLTYVSYNSIIKNSSVRSVNAILTITLFTRMYFVMRFYLFSSNYMKPESSRICKSYYFETNLDFSLKALIKSKPLFLFVFISFSFIFFFSLSIQIFEREIQDPFNNYLTSVYYVLVTMATLGYGDLSAKTNEGRVIGMMACIFGVFLMSMIIISVNNFLGMSKGEQDALYIINKVYVNEDVVSSAKKVINQFSKIISSDRSLRNTISNEAELFTGFKEALNEFNDTNKISQNLNGDNTSFNKIYNSLSSTMNDHVKLHDKQNKNKEELLKIRKEIEEIYNHVMENSNTYDEENEELNGI